MRKRIIRVLCGLLLLLGAGTGRAAEPVEITGRVVDAEGKPVAGLRVSTYWTSEGDRWVTQKGARTDAGGNFALKEVLTSRARSLMVLDDTQEHGAVVTVDAENAAKPLVLTLGPTILVNAAFESSGLGYEIQTTYVSFMARPAQIAIASHRGVPSLALRLPPGQYDVTIGGVDCNRVARRITLAPGEPALDLGTVDLKPTIIAQHYGKAPPAWTVSDARGLDPSVTLDDFKGRWVLLEFWGYW